MKLNILLKSPHFAVFFASSSLLRKKCSKSGSGRSGNPNTLESCVNTRLKHLISNKHPSLSAIAFVGVEIVMLLFVLARISLGCG